jgi:hypothetical protein
MLSSGLGVLGFTWAASPACTELETIVMHWLGAMSGLDKSLLPFECESSISVTPSVKRIHLKEIRSCPNFSSNSDIHDGIHRVEHSENNLNHVVHCGGGVLLVFHI